jgi:hypothetical protein
MRLNVTWSCVIHKERKSYNNVRATAVHSDPGASVVISLSYLLPAKREIKISTLCRECIELRDAHLEEEQLRIIHKLTDLENSLRGVVYWKDRELQWCCSIAKLEKIIKRIETGEQLELRYFCSAVLA